MPDFLLEIGCEEIPARMLDAAREDLARRVGELLAREHLAAVPQLEAFSTPRRLGLIARQIETRQADISEDITGPSFKIAFKDGNPTPAAEAFAKKVGLPVAQLEKVTTPKGEYLSAKVTRKGKTAAEVIAEFVPGEIAKLYWPKNMYWRAGKPERFVRPVRWLVALLDGEVIPLEFAGIKAGRISHGHRVFGNQVELSAPASYAAALAQARVIVTSAEREQKIRKALDAATRAIPGARWREDKALLDTVVNLTEWPSAILGNFDKEFLALPEEVLVTVMRDHQKYFAVEDAQGKLAPHFLAVLNTEPDATGAAVIRHGNERVLRARFNDARFFWETDQKHSLKDRVEMLKHVTFQKDLGNYYEKTLRVQKLASQLSAAVKESGMAIRPGIIHKAALLAKADLTTELVKEFTELQGVVGGLYARAQQLDPDLNDDVRAAVSSAIYDHYKPESMEDAVPRTVEAAVLSIADKADSIAGMFALGLAPTGSKDPFALRRQANGIVKTLAEYKLPIRLSRVLTGALQTFEDSDLKRRSRLPLDSTVEEALRFYLGSIWDSKYLLAAVRPQNEAAGELAKFFKERVEFYLKDVLGFAYDVVNAVLAAGTDDVPDVVARARAVAEVRPSEAFESIALAFKRIKNILRQALEKQIDIPAAIDQSLLREPEEKALTSAKINVGAEVQTRAEDRDYTGALRALAPLRYDLDKFFDKVMVMVDDQQVRANRLALLQIVIRDFSTIADFSEIVTERKGP